jgi:hypothetical protein
VTIAAGTDTLGSQTDMLDYPNGIFVDMKFNLYVVDWGYNKVQFFEPVQVNGTTMTGNTLSGSITLNHLSAAVLDADRYLFISNCSDQVLLVLSVSSDAVVEEVQQLIN